MGRIWTDVAHRQAGVATRKQLIMAGVSSNVIRGQVAAHRWSEWGSHVIVTHNAELTRRQLMWAAVLDAGGAAALASHTSLELAGFRTFASEADRIHLVVRRGRLINPHPQVVVHESRRLRADLHVVGPGPRRTETARSAIDAAAWQRWPRFACALLAAVVQQRIATVEELDHALSYVGRVRHKQHMRITLADVRGGSEALGEIDLMVLCRRYNLRRPQRQVVRRDASGRRRFLDALWELDDGRTVVLEIDGAHHLQVEHWEEDLRREREVVVSGATVLRATTTEVRVEPGLLIADLRAIGVPSCQW